MIDKPELGMRVEVTDARHCFIDGDVNHCGVGVIVEIVNDDSFRVQLDDYPEEAWWRCRECVTAVRRGKQRHDET